jgi:hypothetical protein
MEEEERGFKVRDKRKIGREEGAEEEKTEEGVEEKATQAAKEKPDEESDETGPLPPVSFSSLIISLSTSALLHFGEIPDPISKETKKDLVMAKHTIDMIHMLKEKTVGNLKEDEEKLINSVLYDLKMKYVSETG